MDIATIPALWGSLTGTLALGWQVFRWYRSGPRLKLSVGTTMQFIAPGQPRDETLHVLLNIRNVGEQATTLTHFCGEVYSSAFNRLLRRRPKVFIITTDRIPHKLEPGETWSAYALQDGFTSYPPGSSILLGVQHSMAEKPQLVLVQKLPTAG